MVSPIFNLLDCEILPKRKEIFDKYCKIIRWGRANPTRFIEDFFKLQLTDMQKYVLMSSWIPANIVWLMGRNSRKCLSLDTPVYYRTTDRGEKIEKKAIGDLKVGDVIYDESGNLTEVMHLNSIIIDDEYIIEFEDGEKISCNAEHLWTVYDTQKEKGILKENQHLFNIETKDIYQNIYKGKTTAHRFFIPLTKPLSFSEKEYIIEPYLFGCFISDGRKNRATITCEKQDADEQIKILQSINKNGWIFEKKEYKGYVDILIKHPLDKLDKNGKAIYSEFCQRLRELGVYNNKHIPYEYQCGSVQQRFELLQGLYDCDGSCQNRGR